VPLNDRDPPRRTHGVAGRRTAGCSCLCCSLISPAGSWQLAAATAPFHTTSAVAHFGA
jgi:hypothetical protein